MKRSLVLLGLGLLAGAWVAWAMKPKPPPTIRNVEVPVEVIVASEPDTVVQWRERIVYVTREPTQVADAPGGAVKDVDAFCTAGGYVHGDSLGPLEPQPDRRLLVRSERRDGSNLTLVGPLSDGALRELTFGGVRGNKWQWRTVGDSILMQTDRWWWVGPAIKYGLVIGGTRLSCAAI